jgi:hypothetical protein
VIDLLSLFVALNVEDDDRVFDGNHDHGSLQGKWGKIQTAKESSNLVAFRMHHPTNS